MIQAVIFDLDNTLIDFMRLKRASCDEAIAAMIDAGLSIKKENAIEILFELYDQYGIEDKMIFQKFLKKAIGKIDWKMLASGIVAYRRIKAGFLTPYPGVLNVLLSMKKKGIKLAIVSDAPRMRAWTRLASMRLADFFDVVVTFDDTKKRKPHSLPFETGLKRLGLKAENVLMVGDWPSRDMKGAKKLGIKTCFARYGAVRERDYKGADYIIDDIRQLLDVIGEENSSRK